MQVRILSAALLLCWPAIGQEAEDEPRGREHSVPLFMAHGNPDQRQGFIRIINHSDEPGMVEIEGVDDAGTRYGPIELSLDARQTKHLNSADIENGSAGKGLPDGLGDGEGDWRLLLYGGSLDIEPLAYIRTLSDGFLTSMHGVVPDASLRHRVPIFNPGSNVNQASSLRLINPGDGEAAVTITGRDDAPEDGEDDSEPGEFSLTISPGGAQTVGSAELEMDGIGDGTGKWSLDVRSDVPVQVVNLMSTPAGHLSNLSRANPNYRGATGIWQVSFEDEAGGDGYIILLPDSRMYAWLPEADEVNRMARGTFESTPGGIAASGELYESGQFELQGLTAVGGSVDFDLAAAYRPGDWIRGTYTAEGTDRAFHGWAFTGFERGGAAAEVAKLWVPVLGDDADLNENFEPGADGELGFSFTAGTFTCNVTGTIGPVNPAFTVYEADVTIICSLLILPPGVVDLIVAVFDSTESPGSGDRAMVLAIVHDDTKIGFGAVYGLDES
ncbi:MAG: hypothetical protein OXI79_12360 [Gammaproteobacteria bacterium]|nr:hypothetical protein [Gammaproteobacteria bacterium]